MSRPRELIDDCLYAKSELVNEGGTIGLVNVSPAQLDRMVTEGRFPRPRKVGRRAVRWLGSDIRKWMQGLEST